MLLHRSSRHAYQVLLNLLLSWLWFFRHKTQALVPKGNAGCRKEMLAKTLRTVIVCTQMRGQSEPPVGWRILQVYGLSLGPRRC